ncbi:MAG: glycine zipper 2TM domain-containing protein [Paracoccaceae bacterium]
MRKFLIVMPFVVGLSACVQNSTPQQRTMTGALAGAAVGAAVTDGNDRVKGALIGGALGAAAAQLVGKSSSGQCVYQYPDGRRVIADCN